MKQPKGLGRGLDAIFGTDAVDAKLKPMSQMTEIDIAEIIPNPTQPRTQFDEEALDELADSIRQLGIIQPITVKKSGDGKYIIISGERRWRAAQRADLKSLPQNRVAAPSSRRRSRTARMCSSRRRKSRSPVRTAASP